MKRFTPVLLALTFIACDEHNTAPPMPEPETPVPLAFMGEPELIYLSQTEAAFRIEASKPVQIAATVGSRRASRVTAPGQPAFDYEHELVFSGLPSGSTHTATFTLTDENGLEESFSLDFVTVGTDQVAYAVIDVSDLVHSTTDRSILASWPTPDYASAELLTGGKTFYGTWGKTHMVIACGLPPSTDISYTVRSRSSYGDIFTKDSVATTQAPMEAAIVVDSVVREGRTLVFFTTSNVPGVHRVKFGYTDTYGRNGYSRLSGCGVMDNEEPFRFLSEGVLFHYVAELLEPRTYTVWAQTPDDTVRTAGEPAAPLSIVRTDVTNVTSSEATIEVEVNQKAIVSAKCGRTADTATMRTCGLSSYSTALVHRITINRREAETKYYYYVTAFNLQNLVANNVASPVDSFTTLARTPLELLGFTAVASGDSVIEGTIRTNIQTTGTVTALLVNTSSTRKIAYLYSRDSVHSFRIRGVVGDTTWRVYASMREAGVYGVTPQTVTSDTMFVQTGPRPVFTVENPSVTPEQTKAVASAGTSVDARVCFEYGTAADNLNRSVCSTSLRQTHTATILYLSPGATYYIRARADEYIYLLPRRIYSDVVSFTTLP